MQRTPWCSQLSVLVYTNFLVYFRSIVCECFLCVTLDVMNCAKHELYVMGVAVGCKACITRASAVARSRLWVAENKDRVRSFNAQYRLDNADALRERSRQYY